MTGGTEFARAEEKQRELLMEEVERLVPPAPEPGGIARPFRHPAGPLFPDPAGARKCWPTWSWPTGSCACRSPRRRTRWRPSSTGTTSPTAATTPSRSAPGTAPGLFRKIAGSLSAAGLNILSAQIFTRTDGIVLDTFFVTDAMTGNLAGREQRDEFEKISQRR